MSGLGIRIIKRLEAGLHAPHTPRTKIGKAASVGLDAGLQGAIAVVRDEMARESWQSIDTAPKDRKILAFATDRFDASRLEMHTTFWNNGRWASFTSHFQPTHWMPLPEPPK